MKYIECEEYISDISKFIKSDINKTKEIITNIISKEEMPEIIHVAGTNGKGSVCTYIENILMESGFSVGKFVSPHLVTMRERINYNGNMIAEMDFVNSFEKVKNLADNMDYQPNYFEYTLLIALDYYKKMKPDYIILETGLGGRKDQTNYVSDRKIAVITEIGLDHMAYLGDTYDKIAYEKAGIIKPDNKVVYFNKRHEASSVISKEAASLKAESFCIEKTNIKNARIINDKVIFDYKSLSGEIISNIEVNSPALYQCENAALAIETVLAIADNRITNACIKKGLNKAKWPGRMELLKSSVYIDGAHNVDGIEAFIDTVKAAYSNDNNYLLFGVVADKEYEKMAKMLALSGLFTEILVTKLDTDRTSSIDELKKAFDNCPGQNVSFYQSVSEGYNSLIEKGQKGNMFSVGSLYLVGQIKEIENKKQGELSVINKEAGQAFE